MAKKVLIPIAPGFEEIEALAVVDILRRAGIEVVTAGTTSGAITGRNDITITPDRSLGDIITDGFDMIVLPGGVGGTENLKSDERIIKMLRAQDAQGKLIAAICAAPVILKAAGVAKDKRLTSHPSVAGEFAPERYTTERVVVDNTLITSRGPGTAIEFALKIVETLCDKEVSDKITAAIVA